MKFLFVGFGSIAKKHVEVLQDLVPELEIFALRSNKNQPAIDGVTSVYGWNDLPKDLNAICITNPTAKHLETLRRAIKLGIPIFIEKPVFHGISEATNSIIQEVLRSGIPTYTACNLRFHPIIRRVKDELQNRQALEVSAYCGSYLPDWRPGQDYREVYSAKKELGGGVHLDLIHEIDYLQFWFGPPQQTTSYFRQKSSLEIDTPDIAHYILEYSDHSAFVTLNYYRKQPKRSVEIVWEDETWEVDLLESSITDSSGKVVFKWDFDIMETYREQMKHFLEVCSGKPSLNPIDEGYKTLATSLNQSVYAK